MPFEGDRIMSTQRTNRKQSKYAGARLVRRKQQEPKPDMVTVALARQQAKAGIGRPIGEILSDMLIGGK